jgi:3-hydroxybutyrate dehydrogenase
MDRLKGRVAIVTGAAGGLGAAVYAAFAAEGASVLPVDIKGDDCLHVDVGTEAGNREMIETALARYGQLDVLVLNAGTQYMAPLAEYPEAQWDRLMNVMLKGPLFAIQHAWPALTARPGGRIIVTASISSLQAERYKVAYVAAKHGVLGLVRVAALEGAPFGLTVNAVAPGGMHTPLIESQVADQMRLHNVTREEYLSRMAARHPGGNLVDPAEVANTMVFLASPESAGINGTCITVDHGLMAGA